MLLSTRLRGGPVAFEVEGDTADGKDATDGAVRLFLLERGAKGTGWAPPSNSSKNIYC